MSDATQAMFDKGHEVGQLARQLYPDGVEIPGEYYDYDTCLGNTSESLRHRKPLFEPAFLHNRSYARADILEPIGRSEWDLVEVKSSANVKPEYYDDLALQWFAITGSGVKLKRCHILHIDSSYVRRGGIEPKKLFRKSDVTAEVKELLPSVAEHVHRMIGTVRKSSPPRVDIGPHCGTPHACPMESICWKSVPEQNVLTITRIGQRGYEWMKDGIVHIKDLPRDAKLSSNQSIQVAATKTGTPHINHGRISDFLSRISYPAYFLDFETFMSAIPIIEGTRPFENIPFQYSLHVQASPRSKPRHHAFLATGERDPRAEILRNLKPLIGTEGSIIAYNSVFEIRCLKESANANREYDRWVESLRPRFLDLLAPFRSFHYYHPDQYGSGSIKAVYPALVGKDYDGMDISEGGTASREYMRVTFGKDVEPDDRERVRKALLDYCETDTMAMVEIVRELRGLVK